MSHLAYLLSLGIVSDVSAGTVGIESLQRIEGITPSWTDGFGRSVALNGDTLVVGTPRARDGKGEVTLYRKSSRGKWEKSQTLKLGQFSSEQYGFGATVAISGNAMAIGAPGSEPYPSRTGAVHLLTRNADGIWEFKERFYNYFSNRTRSFGDAIAISDDTVVVTAPKESDAFIFQRIGLDWSSGILNTDLFPGGTFPQEFGTSVDIDGDLAIFGSPDHRPGYGGAFLFKRTEPGTWEFVTSFLAGEDSQYGKFGHDVAIDGNRIVIGSPNEFGPSFGAGAAYVYRADEHGAWQLETRLVTTEQEGTSASFGSSVAIDDGHIIIGAPRQMRAYLYPIDENVWASPTEVFELQAGWSNIDIALDGRNVVFGLPDSNYALAYTIHVPEPQSISLLVYVVLGVARRRRPPL